MYAHRPWAVLVPFFNKDGRYVNISLDWTDFFSHDESYCGDTDLLKSIVYPNYDNTYYAKVMKTNRPWLYKALPLRALVSSLQNYSGYGGFDLMLDDNVRSKYYKRIMIDSLKKALQARKNGESFVWSVHTYDLYYQRIHLADVFENALYEEGEKVKDYTTRLIYPKLSQDIARKFLLRHSLVKNEMIVMHIRRAVDALRHYKCKRASPDDVAELLVNFTRHCSQIFQPGFKVAFHTDEYSHIFLNETADKIKQLDFLPFHIDSLLFDYLEEQIAIGKLNVMHLNNYFIYMVIHQIRQNQKWLLDIHRPKFENGKWFGTCEKSSWNDTTCVPTLIKPKSYDQLWLTVGPHIPPNRTKNRNSMR